MGGERGSVLCSGGGATTLGRRLKKEVGVAPSLDKRRAALLEGLQTRAALQLQGGGAPHEAGDPHVQFGLCLTVECLMHALLVAWAKIPLKFLVVLTVILGRQGNERGKWTAGDPTSFLDFEVGFMKKVGNRCTQHKCRSCCGNYISQ